MQTEPDSNAPPMRLVTLKSVVLFLILFISGALLTFYSSDQLLEEFTHKSWPKTKAEILESRVSDTGSTLPVMKYSYEVDAKTYQDSTRLQAPGFGNRAKQYDVAMNLVRKYPKGKIVSVYYDPDDHADSYVIVTPRWDTYTKLSLGVVLLLSSLIYSIFSIRSLSKSSNR